MTDLINKLLEFLASFYTEKPQPSPIIYDSSVVHDDTILEVFQTHGIRWAGAPEFSLEDEWFHFPNDIADWLEICYQARTQCPPYSSNSFEEAGFECEDFASFFPAWAKAKHGFNACWEVWGGALGGGHAWNVVMAGDEIYEIEPQTGETWLLGTNKGYKAIIVK